MTAAWMWARSDLRARWRSWIVLGVLAGVTVGIAAAGVAGARRTRTAIPRALAASPRLDAAVLPNDPTFDARQRAAVAALPEVAGAYPFVVPFFLNVVRPQGAEGQLIPTTPASARALSGVLVEGRFADPRRQEIVIDEHLRDRYGLHLGSTVVMAQHVDPDALPQLPLGDVPDGVDLDFRAPLRVVGIQKAFGEGESVGISPALYRRYEDRLLGPINMFVTLRHGERQFERFRADVQEIVGRPVAVARGSDLLGVRQSRNVSDLEANGLLLFALAAFLGGGVLVGQALVRAVTAGAADVPTWRAIGGDRRTMTLGMVLPAFLVVAVGAVAAVLTQLALSPRFPIGATRTYEIDLGVRADWWVMVGSLGVFVGGVVLLAAVAAWWRTVRGESEAARPSAVGDWAARAGLPPAMVVGSRLAVEPGRGRRAVPVRSALIGAIAGVIGVVACLTFRAGIDDALATPTRSGIVWDSYLVTFGGPVADETVAAVRDLPGARGVLDATWARAVAVDGVPTPMFGIRSVEGRMDLVVLSGRAPRGTDEVAFAPTTLDELGLRVGDRVRLGSDPDRTARVVGTALLPETSHTAYDQSGWMTRRALDQLLAVDPLTGPEDLWGLELVRWAPGTAARGEAGLQRLAGDSGYATPATLPGSVRALHNLRSLPLVLAVFFALLAVATVGHALVTTVRRRRHDLAVMRSFGFTGRQSRLAIAWQATLLAVAGVAVGVPVGIGVGRWVWRWLATDFPFAYVPPLAAAVVVVVPVAILVVNALAALPARSAARIKPAEALRVE